MSFLKLRNSTVLFAFLFFLQLTNTLPVSGRNLVNFQRVTRNDPGQYYQQLDSEVADADIISTTSEHFVSNDEETFTNVELETVDSSTVSSVIQDDMSPFILVASDGNIANEPVPSVEIVTPSFLNMDDLAESEPTEKLGDPFVHAHIKEEPFPYSLANSQTEVPEEQLSLDALSAPAVLAPENLPVVTDSLDVSVPVLVESESSQKFEDPSVNPLVDDVPTSDEVIAPAVEDPSADPVVASAPVSDEVEPAQKLEDPFVDTVIVAIPISDETVPVVEDPSVDPLVVSDPITDDVEPAQKLEDPFVETEQVSSVVLEDSSVLKVPSEDTEFQSVAQSDPVDLPPPSPPVFISSVSPVSPIIIATLAPLEPVSPVSSAVEKIKISSSAMSDTLPSMGTLPKVKNGNSIDQQNVTQHSAKQPAVYNKPSRPISPTKLQVSYKYQPITSSPLSLAYGPTRTSTNPQSLDGKKNNFPTRTFGSSPKPRQLGFPPISSTRENVLLEVNWEGKLGRPYRQAKLH